MNSRLPDNNLFQRKLPLFFSTIFHPLAMPLLGIVFLLFTVIPYSLMSNNGKFIIISIVLVCTLILPLVFLPLIFRNKVQDFLNRNEREERIIPLMVSLILFYIAFYLLHQIGAPLLIQVFILSSAFSVFFVLTISFFWKISAHTVGIGGVISLAFILLYFYHLDVLLYLFMLIFIGGIIGYSRLSLNAHTPAQVYTGYLLGFLVMFFSFLII
jgi:membrane-associated phospholipid phosphatase